jgi:DNA-binding transcriptional MerR regulator
MPTPSQEHSQARRVRLVNASKDRLTVPHAAKLLGVTPEAIRQRIRRGTIEHEQDENGRYFVYTSPTEAVENNLGNGVENGVQNDSQAQLDHIETLKRELELRNEELRRKDHIIAALVNRVPELEATPEPRDAHETASPRSDKGSAQEDAQEPAERRSWLYRFFFGSG